MVGVCPNGSKRYPAGTQLMHLKGEDGVRTAGSIVHCGPGPCHHAGIKEPQNFKTCENIYTVPVGTGYHSLWDQVAVPSAATRLKPL